MQPILIRSRPKFNWYPQTLAARIFLVFSLTTFSGTVIGLAVLNYQQINRHLQETREAIEKLAEVAKQPITDSAVVGDYDAISRILHKLLPDSPLREVSFRDPAGGLIRVSSSIITDAPGWLITLVSRSVPDLKKNITIGGRSYGQLVLIYDPARVASELWSLMLKTALLAVLGLAMSLLIMQYAMRRWLSTLESLKVVEAKVLAGSLDAQAMLNEDAPLEIRKAIEVVNRTSGSLRAQFGQRIDTLMHALIQHKNAMDEAAIVCELDQHGRITSANEGFLNAVGLPLEQLYGRMLDELNVPKVESNHKPQTSIANKWRPSPNVWRGDIVVYDATGKSRVLRRSVIPIFDEATVIEKYICIDFDISAQKESELALMDQLKRQSIITTFGHQALDGNDLEALMQKVVEWVCIGLRVKFSALLSQDDGESKPIIKVGVGWEDGWIGGPALSMATSAPGTSRMALPEAMLSRHSVCNLQSVPSEENSLGRGFTLVAASQEVKSFSDSDRDFLLSLAHVLSSAMERHYSRERLTYLARFDSLTGLPNRGLLLDRLERALAAVRVQGTYLGLLYLDLDRFKQVNDTLGHDAGDELLIQASQRIATCLRASDTVARLAGDEFAILLPSIDVQADAELVGRKVLTHLAHPFEIRGQEIFISGSIGAAIYPTHGFQSAQLLHNADQAMYHAKKAGRNAFCFYSDEIHDYETKRLEINAHLRAALERKEFSLVYQPKVNLTTGCISGLEALLRWSHPNLGPISPVDFVPMLEESGLILDVGEWLLREVAQQVAQWQSKGLDVPRVAINLSARQLASSEFDQTVREILNKVGASPTFFEFELTESMLMQDPDKAVIILQQFRAHGIKLSLDDFGTGYSSLAYLRRFPIDVLKIDRTFIKDLTADSDCMEITLTIIKMAHSLNLEVVAEGVETTEQLDLLTGAGCNDFQGFYFSRPLPAQDIERLLNDKTALQWQESDDVLMSGFWRLPELSASTLRGS